MKGLGWFHLRGRRLRMGWHYRHPDYPDMLLQVLRPSADGWGVECAVWHQLHGWWHDSMSDMVFAGNPFQLKPCTVFEEEYIGSNQVWDGRKGKA